MPVSQNEFFGKDIKMSLFSKKQTGEAGEEYCAKYLKKHGFKILDRNYRKPFGEIDIVAVKNNVLCFVEVKTRHYKSLTQPYEAVDFRKRQRIINAAQAYLTEKDYRMFCRFDVCEVITDKDTLKLLRLNYIENAFEMG